jgi:phosphoribosylformylglycinamidine cyclo-ligase
MPEDKFTYKESGVDIKAAAELVGDINTLRAATESGRRKLFGAFGLFAAAYDLSAYRQPVIVTGCDGVGSKLEVLLQRDALEIAGKDLVAMSVNDILTTGGDPLLFLDYVGVGNLEKDKVRRLIAGMSEYLADCDCILAGGETAEMPGIVPDGMIELAGFCIGAVEKPDLLDPSSIEVGDVVVGYPSDGVHANGWSLVRRILATYPQEFSDADISVLLAPTRLYHDVVAGVRDAGVRPRAMAHITGGGLPENLERLIPGKGAELRIPYWDNAVVQKVLAHTDEQDRFNTFNMGIGWCVITRPEDAGKIGGRVLGQIVETEGVRVEVSPG